METLTSLLSLALIASAIRVTMPILLTALGAVYSERSGVVNIGLEGIMIMGTFFGAVGSYVFAKQFPGLVSAIPDLAPLAGVLTAVLAGMGFGLIHAVVTVTYRVNQIISGVALNLLASGLARFLNILLFTQATQSPGVQGFTPIDLPLLKNVTVLGPLVRGISPMIIVGLILVLVLLESCAIAVLGGTIGLGLAYLLTLGGDPTGGLFPSFFLPPAELIRGGLFALGLGLVAGMLPAVQAMRLRIVDALRRT